MERKIIKFEDFDFDLLKFETYEIGNKRKKSFVKNLMTWDIETSELPLPIEGADAQPFMWCWQAQVNQFCIIGRKWSQFNKLLEEINARLGEATLFCCVHNLDFEFSFAQSWIKFDEVFRNSYAPDKIYFARAGHIKFIDSGKISESTLEELTQGCEHEKTEMDYDELRFADTPITPEELEYISNDVTGLVEGMERFMKSMSVDAPDELPLTSSGFAKEIAKNNHLDHPYKIHPVPYACLKLLQWAARGGNVWCPKKKRGVLQGETDSADADSMYPSVMVTEQYPVGAWRELPKVNDQVNLGAFIASRNRGNQAVFEVTFKGLRLKNPDDQNPYIVYRREKGDEIVFDENVSFKDLVKANRIHEYLDGDRVLKAAFFHTALITVDLDLINEHYDFDDIIIHEAWESRQSYLPAPLRKLIVDRWLIKERGEDGSPKKKQAKKFINTLFGAMGQNPLYPQLQLDEHGNPKKDEHGHYIKSEVTEEDYIAPWWVWYTYAWFVWTSAWGRYRLQKAIDLCGNKLFYCDTDAVKFPLGTVDLESLNKEIRIKNQRAGVPDGMGIFRSEYVLDRFVAMGSKQWCGENQRKKGKLTPLVLTCSGLKTGKTEAVEELAEAGGIEAFKPGFVFKRTGLGPVKINRPAEVIEFEGHQVELGCGRLIRPRPEYPIMLEEVVLSPEKVQQAEQEQALEEVAHE